ncbi:MAG: TIGR03905 family TSCPD domain-containing protein [Galactobacillus timonensis]|jgi:uncharacterized protein (TIGR03905 family)|uniref:TIGR03905 family TSCPD domain-containing protein n=1 Tax=Galactobacillus timonensis TaxID=2041840 RepID=UPI000C822112|nr:TIGR03905 family TSCPD domain-containing protein [Galactobacillus timonensis]MDY5222195.1 TIGR03905 family TSCPD domain-containing protein [Lachnospiraceae bacterium]MDY6282918.1 TIGR03905 family TSCPD domain-containing protein [Erysipelotrichaceae bacterium]MCI6067687.1 TIGR03905 family TSCPD domain-containing protein [Galactobacillus timonensis]MCI6753538.1 TIGR03905 family TSCPD domain-containing protein [Galactobacillus timonensis]MDD5852165.1 TIGR03905 family TSCPD domain-containing pr
MSERYIYHPKGTCSTEMIFDIEDHKVKNLEVVHGCNGNLKGIASLVQGMDVDEVIKRLDGITCGMKPTSCPDQIAKGLEAWKEQH